MRGLLALCALLALAAAPPPVRGLPPHALPLPDGAALPLFANADPVHPPDLARAVIVLHGLNRDADTYFAALQAAQREADVPALLLAPQVLAGADVAALHPPAADLHFAWNRWAEGYPAEGPRPDSLFDALDALLAHLARAMPALRQVVIAGHSAGAQLVQRYAVVGNGPDALAARGIAVRFVVANPSSYLWFGPDRPLPGGGFGPPPDAAACPHYADWRYGLGGTPPPYVRGTPAALEARYAARDVVYLLGTADTNPHHRLLDVSCAGEAQGPSRYARGHGYVALLRARHPGLRQRLADIPGVGHNGRRMLTAACARAALFDTPTCPDLSR